MSSIWQTLKSALGAGSAPARARRRSAGTSSFREFPYRACAIEPGEDACAAVTKLQAKRFLQVEVPRLPLPGCGRLQCDCRYRHYEDRRQLDEDRRSVGALATQTYPFTEEERRDTHGRRVGDDSTGDDILLK